MKTCWFCQSTPAYPAKRNGDDYEPLCLACYEKFKAEDKDYKVKVTFTEWVFSDSPESAISNVKDTYSLGRHKDCQVEVVETRPIKWDTVWNAKILQVIEAVKSGKLEAAQKLVEDL